jgi:hypothetical protein
MPESVAGASSATTGTPIKTERPDLPYFGVSIEKITEREGNQVPILVSRCIEYLIRDLDEVGILRLSGSLAEINELKDRINHGNYVMFRLYVVLFICYYDYYVYLEYLD